MIYNPLLMTMFFYNCIKTFSHHMELEKRVVELINNERIKAGLHLLTLNPRLTGIARIKSEDIFNNNCLDCQSPTLGSLFDMLKNSDINYFYAAENISIGKRTSESVLNTWMKSSEHRENILNTNFTEVGVGLSNIHGTLIWTCLFITA